jgi:4-amino-4-deoxy-L-arabinose transferase-like glycosyltransferase
MPRAVEMRLTSPLLQFLGLLAVALPFFINLDKSALWDGNETFYAETPREMLETGNYLAPMFNYEPRPQKPPLTYWMVLLGYRAVGIQELGVRLPGALAVVGTILFTYGIARLLFSRNAALLSAAIIATTLRLFILARKLPIDVLLLFWMTGTAYFFVRALQKGSRRDGLLAYLFAGLGFLTKGPVAWVIPGLSCLIWSLWARRFKFSAIHPWIGVSILAAVTVPWYALTYLHYGWTYITDFFLKDNFARFATEIRGPIRGPFYYLGVYLGDFFPWSLLSIGAGIWLWLQRKSWSAQSHVAYGFPLVWSAVTLVLFSASKNKQEYYIVPLYPLAAVLLAGVIDHTLFTGAMIQRGIYSCWRILILATGCVFLALACISPFILPSLIPNSPAVLHYAPAVILLFAAVILMREAGRGQLAKSVTVMAVSMWLVLMMAGLAYLPAIEPLRPVKRICSAIQDEARAGDEVGYFRAAVPSMLFYLRRQIFAISNPPAMQQKFQGARRVFCVLGERDYRYFRDECGLNLYVLQRCRQLPTQLTIMLGKESPTGEGDQLLLVSNRPHNGNVNSSDRKNP